MASLKDAERPCETSGSYTGISGTGILKIPPVYLETKLVGHEPQNRVYTLNYFSMYSILLFPHMVWDTAKEEVQKIGLCRTTNHFAKHIMICRMTFVLKEWGGWARTLYKNDVSF